MHVGRWIRSDANGPVAPEEQRDENDRRAAHDAPKHTPLHCARPGTPFIGDSDLTPGGDSGSGGTRCERAKKIADGCNASQPSDSGVEINFDQAKCESSGAQGQAAAQCIIDNSTNCDCLLPCAINQTCR